MTTFREAISNDAAVTRATGKASEALEYVERARGHLYSLHQLIGRADFLFEEAAELFEGCGHEEWACKLDEEIVGRNVLDGRWTFQIVEEFDDGYYAAAKEALRSIEAEFHEGKRHVYEAQMKEVRRTHGRRGHEHRPPGAHDATIEIDG